MSLERDKSLDIISGIMIIWMVILHSFQWGNLTESIIYIFLLKCLYFFMAWFYFKTGFLYKIGRGLINTFKKGIDQLIIPMLIWTAIGYLLTIPELLTGNYPLWKIPIAPLFFLVSSGDTIGNSPLWFLLSLFFIKIMFPFIARLNLNIKKIIAISLLCLSWVFEKNNIKIPFGLHSFPLGLFFTLSGLLCNEFRVPDRINKIRLWLILPYIALSIFLAGYVDFHNNNLMYGNYWLFTLNTLIAINLCLVLFKDVNLTILSWIGKKSLVYLVIHWPIFYLIKISFEFLNISTKNYLYVVSLNIIAICISTLIAKFVPYKYLGLQSSLIVNFNTKIISERN
ncbi:O-acetyl transferase [Formosa agariphila KMM 3901]|uniref:O-acetyl transferase n=1 Tax=Formosa agariphila (strain DSM 15362 / KCTC 12365 / LMG 23005 / KMM 3901 / M-2Alg 35-1) TaxID=1347342 RepID=T2KPE3_FORAG|nr:acyltransferase family protein [Formosa agariphila]CDF80625.1 O-acetyl transferase [Formosa agariphila KMM 3901]